MSEKLNVNYRGARGKSGLPNSLKIKILMPIVAASLIIFTYPIGERDEVMSCNIHRLIRYSRILNGFHPKNAGNDEDLY